METTLLGRATFGGLASGIDTNALLQGLLQLERIPLNRIESRRADIDSQRGLMRDLNTKLLALRSAARELDNRNDRDTDNSLQEEFLRFSGTSTNEDVVTVSAGFGATPGDIQVVVDKLAKGSRHFSVPFASNNDPALSGTEFFSVSLNDEDLDAVPPVEQTQIVVTPEDGGTLSLQAVRDEINTHPNNGGKVRADILKISDNEFKLVIASTGTGLSNNMSLGGNINIQGPDPDGGQAAIDEFLAETGAANSEFRLFGSNQVLQRESNIVEDALTGVTLRLLSTSELREDFDPDINPGQEADFRIPETVAIEVDVDEVAAGLEKFIKAYNDVVGFIDRQFRFDDTQKSSGPLAGDFTLREVQRELRSIVSKGYAFSQHASNPFAPSTGDALGGSISNIGVEIVDGGLLRLNKETLEEALALDANSVREFLSGASRRDPANQAEIDAAPPGTVIEPDLYDEGFAQLLSTRLERLVRSGDGALASRDAAFAKRLAEFDVSIERFEFRLAQREETLIQRFSSLERIVSGLQSQQGFLSGLG